MTMIDTADTRFSKAIALADQAGQWLKIRYRDGRKAYGIRSSRGDRYYAVTRSSCDCEDRRRHPGNACKHMQAVCMHCARVIGKPMSASATVDGLIELVRKRAAKYADIFARLDD
jgi:hypothetical protein